jgi:hypothetical protein
MDLHCIHCSERVDRTMSTCRACGGDPWVKATEDVIDLTEPDPERETIDLLASMLAGFDDEPPPRRPRWGENLPTALELDLTPFRVSGRGSADVLPEASRSRFAWRR